MADRKLPELRTRLRLDTSDLDRADGRIARFTRNFSDPKAMAGYQARLKQIGDQADETGSRLTRNLTLPVAAAGAVSYKLASDFNKTFTTMTSLAGVTTAELDSLKEQVKDLARETGRSPQELAEALYFIRSAGLDGADAMDALEASAKGAAIGLGDAKSVADAATSAVNAYGAENLTASQAVDQLTAAVAEGKGEAAAFAPQIGQILPLAKQLGVEFGEVAGSMAYFTKTGTPVAQAATMVQGVLQKLIAPTQQGKETLKEYGVSLEELQATVSNQGLLAGLQLLDDRLGGDPQALRRVFDDIEGYTGVLGLLRDGGQDAAAVLDAVAGSSESVAQAFGRLQGTDEFKAQQAITDLQVAAIELGQKLVPIVSDLADGVSGLVDIFTSLPQPVQTGLLALVGAAAILGPLAKGFSLAADGVGLLLRAASSKALDGFRLGLQGVEAAGAGADARLGAMLRTIGIAGVAGGVAGIGALAAAFQYMQVEAERARANVSNLQAQIESGLSPAEAAAATLSKTLAGVDGGFQDLAGSSEEFRKKMEELGFTSADVVELLTAPQAEFDKTLKSILNTPGQNKNELSEFATNLNAMREATGGAAEANRILTETNKELGVETEDASDATDDFSRSQAAARVPISDTTDEMREQADEARSLFDAHRSVTDAADAVADAQQELADAQRAAAPGSEENRRALEAVADAERAVQDAQAESADAQRSLTEARKEAAENLEDLALAASGAQVAEGRAAVDLAKAKSDLLKASTPLEVAEAKQRIAEAEQALLEAREANGDAAGALADAQAKGIEGSDAVVAAQERITAAREGEREAQARLAEASRNAAEVQAEASARVQEAQERLTDAELNHIDAQAKVVELTDGTAASTTLLIDELSALAAKLGPEDPLRRNLLDYIALLREMRGLESGDGINNTGRTGGAPEGVVVSTGQITGGDALPRVKIPSPTAVVPPPTGGDTGRSKTPMVVHNEFRFDITGQPDAATLAVLEDVATRSVDKAMRKVVTGSGV